MPHLLSKEMSDLSNLSRSLELVLDFFLNFQNLKPGSTGQKPGSLTQKPGFWAKD